jgi:predicted dehydrogenase
MSFGVAIVGTGMVARYHQQAILASGATLVAVAHHKAEKYHQLSQKFGVPCLSIEDVLKHPEVEAVCICTPSGQHAAQTIAAAQAGKHVLVEKPMALSLQDADAMIEICQKHNVRLGVVLQRRSETLFKQVKSALEAGDLGNLTLASVTMPYLRTQSYYDQADWRGTWEQDGGGILINQGIHLLDLLLWFMGNPVKVQARASTLVRNIEVEDTLVATLQFASGALATFTATSTTAPGFPHCLELYGTQGGIQLEGEGVRTWTLNQPEHAKIKPLLGSDTSAGSGGDPRGIKPTGHINLFKDFMQAIREKRSPQIDGIEGRRSLKTILEIYQAAHLSQK